MKRLTSLLITIIIALSALQVPTGVFASAFKNTVDAFTYGVYSIPKYDGDSYEVLRGGEPNFTASQLNQNIYEKYGAFDSLGRVTACTANIDRSLMPTGKRGDISSVYPTGWKQKKYDFISNGGWLYNRSHLIGWQLTGENANKNNLMTGTRSFNAIGMLPFENEVSAYVKKDAANNVLYRVTPVFAGSNLLAYGVIMEAMSVDDGGAAVKFCVFVYNVQSGVKIDYETGQSIANNETIDLSGAYIELSKYKYAYTGKAYTPGVKVKLKGAVISPSYYTVTYTANKNVGTAIVTVKGRNAYRGSKKVTFTIVPKSTNLKKIKPAKKALTVTWTRKKTQTTGYKLQYSLSSNMKNSTTVTIKDNTLASRKITKLKAKKRYYFRICTYKKVGGRDYCSAWSAVMSNKTK